MSKFYRRVAIVVFMLLLVVVVFWIDRTFTSGLRRSGVLVTIGKDTTYITSPLRPDGYVDYVAALNERASRGVTPENNAAVLFRQAMGPARIRVKDRAEYFKMLGISALPGEGDYFIDFDAYSDDHPEPAKRTETPIQGDTTIVDPKQDRFLQSIHATSRPWSKSEFPIVAAWLTANEKPLSLIIQASKRPRRYDPLQGDCLFLATPPSFYEYREVARALESRAMLRIGEDRIDDAWNDLLACHRLARLMGQGEGLLDALVAITLDGVARYGDLALLRHGRLSAAQIAAIRADLNELPPLPAIADRLDVAGRFVLLDCVENAARDGLCAASARYLNRDCRGLLPSLIDASGRTLDWDIVLRVGNSWCDQLVDACRKSPRSVQVKAIDAVVADMGKPEASADRLSPFVFSMLFRSRATASDHTGRTFAALFLPGMAGPAAFSEHRSTMERQLLNLAFALAAYHADHGSYPAKLADLVPKYMESVPKDLFNDADLHYQAADGDYTLYSVGPNGQDDGGRGIDDKAAAESSPSADWDDIVIKMPAPK
jgi:hypothetical protein